MNRRTTKQREQIYHVVSTLYHPTAEEVYSALHTEHPSVGKATVFRNLAVLSEEGKLVKLLFANGTARYDATVDGHAHGLCRLCGEIVDLPTAQSPFPPSNDLFSAETCEIIFYGLCNRCNQSSLSSKQP